MMSINEEALTNRVHAILDKVFPTHRKVGLEHQHHFSVKLGHHNLKVDNKSYEKDHVVQAKADILLSLKDQNLILFELKAPGHVIDEDDRKQGLSYARLLEQMPPLVIISNGDDTHFYNTYSAKPFEEATVDAEAIQKLIRNSFRLAASDLQNAIFMLLNREPKLFAKIITAISADRFKTDIGEVDNLYKPITKEFLIPRLITGDVYQLSHHHQLIGIIGASFSGKTNVLYQFFDRYNSEQGHYILYFDALDVQFSLLQQLATRLMQSLKTSVTVNDVRHWINSSLYDDTTSKFILLIDNLHQNLDNTVAGEIYELIDSFKASHHTVIYSISEFQYQKIGFKPDRKYQSTIGDESKLIKLEELNLQEYCDAHNLLVEKFKVNLQLGGQKATEYRKPRVWRNLAAYFSTLQIEENMGYEIDAVPGMQVFSKLVSNKIYSDEVHKLYKKLSHAFLADSPNRKASQELNVAATTDYAISHLILETTCQIEYARSMELAIVILRDYSTGLKIVIPKLPELFAIKQIEVIYEHIVQMFESDKSSDEIFDFLLLQTNHRPYGDIVASSVLYYVSELNVHLFSNLTRKFIAMQPETSSPITGTQVLLFNKETGPKVFTISEGMELEASFVSVFGWSVASHLAGERLELIGGDLTSKWGFNLYLIWEIGNNSEHIPRFDFLSFKDIMPQDLFEDSQGNKFAMERSGITEPIVQSIQKFFLFAGDEFDYLTERSFSENKQFLLWRIYLAINDMVNIVNVELAQRASVFVSRFKREFPFFFNILD